MAILFTSQDNSEVIQIGGAETISSPTTGGIGPFPRYSISREEIATGDGTFLNSKYTIAVTGTATLKSTTNQNMLVQGERQRAVQGEALIKIFFNRKSWPMHGNGLLTIDSYGASTTNKIQFLDAKLISVELPEQNDETAGVQNLEYSFTFEAYQIDENFNSSNSGASTLTQPTYLLSSAEENWEIQVNENQYTIDPVQADEDDLNDTPSIRTYTLTHTLSATGNKKFTGTTANGVDTDGAAWRQASQWVKSRLLANPTTITTDLVGNTDTTSFDPDKMDKTGTTDMGYDLSSLTAFNHVRQVQSDIGAGSYSVTDTWVMADEPTKIGGDPSFNHTIDLEVSEEAGEESPEHVVTVQGTIQGLDSRNSYDLTSTAYENARAAWNKWSGQTGIDAVYTVAKSVYSGSGALRNVVLSQTVGHNRNTGTITFSRVFDDTVIDIDNAIRQDLTVNYNNIDGTQKVVAILGVLSRADGPIIQDMNTTKERSVSVSLDLTMDKASRGAKPSATEGADTSSASQIWTVVSAYRPTNGYLQDKTENWNPRTGTYNLSVVWVFNESYVEDPTPDPPPSD